MTTSNRRCARTLYDDARRRVLDELNAEAELAYAQLCTAANERGRQFGQGPTVANLLALLGTGPLGGSGSAILYPYLPVPGPDSGLPRRYWDLTAQQLIRASEDDGRLRPWCRNGCRGHVQPVPSGRRIRRGGGAPG